MTAMATNVPRVIVRHSSDVPDNSQAFENSKFNYSADGSRNLSALHSRSNSYTDVHNDRSLHIPSAPSNARAQSQSGSLGSTASRATSIDDGELSNSRAGLDPVTQLVLKRTIPSGGARHVTDFLPDQKAGGGYDGQRLDGAAGESNSGIGQPKEKEKEKRNRVSFLSRLVGNKRKDNKVDTESYIDGAVSEHGDSRPEGADAQPFSQPIDNLGYNPKSPLPPSYIKIRAKNRKGKADFDRIFLAQQLAEGIALPRLERRLSDVRISRSTANSGGVGVTAATVGAVTGVDKQPIWTMEFSRDGKYLAAAGQSKVVRVWAVLSTPEERRAHEKAENKRNNTDGERLSAPVFHQKVFREYTGHTSTVLDLSWSKNNFLLSSSMDKTIRLWHISRTECLCTFRHSDFVPSIRFHPKDDRFFLAGSLDSKLRLWSIPDKSVAYWSQMPEMITAVSFTPDGKTAIAGCLNGICVFYDTDGLKYQTQIQVRSSHGKNAKGSKITGIQTAFFPPGDAGGEVKILISSNDSRIRLYNLRDKSLELKFKGHENNYSQIRATFADDGRYIICGSEDRKVFVWPTDADEAEKQDKRPFETFEAHTTMTTSAVLAPTKTRQLLSASEDPIFDVCNPPPVTLVSKAESVVSSKPPAENNENENENGSVSVQATTPAVTEASFKKAEETPAYLSRTAHPSGHILVTADYTGAIKAFRQDCAFKKRRTFIDHAGLSAVNGGHGIGGELNSGASLLSKRIGAGLRSRPVSTSASHSPVIGGGGGGIAGAFHKGANMNFHHHTGENAAHPHLPMSDRIQSWRHSIQGFAASSIDRAQSHSSLKSYENASNVSSQRNSMSQVSMSSLRNGHNHNYNSDESNKNQNQNSSTRNTNKNTNINIINNKNNSINNRKPQNSTSAQPFDNNDTTSSRALPNNSPSQKGPKANADKESLPFYKIDDSTSSLQSQPQSQLQSPSQPQFESENPLWIQGEQSYLFWDKQAYKTQVEAARRGNGANDGAASTGSLDHIRNHSFVNSTTDAMNGDAGNADASNEPAAAASASADLLSSSAATARPGMGTGMLSVNHGDATAAGRFRNGIRRLSTVSALSSDLSSLSSSSSSLSNSGGGKSLAEDNIERNDDDEEDEHEHFADAHDTVLKV